MERSRTQLELDWQRRYEEKESNQYEKSEDLIKKLAKSRDEVISESRIELVKFCCPAWSFYMYIIWVYAYFHGERPCNDISNFNFFFNSSIYYLFNSSFKFYLKYRKCFVY